jgi:regulator of replication initiation timing
MSEPQFSPNIQLQINLLNIRIQDMIAQCNQVVTILNNENKVLRVENAKLKTRIET